MVHTARARAEALADTCRRVSQRLDELCARHPGGEQLHRARDRFAAPPRVAVSGREGSGRRTLRTAIEGRLGCLATDTAGDMASGDADVLVHLLVAPPRAADLDVLDLLPADRTLVVLGKADAVDPAEFLRADVTVGRAAPLLAVLRPTDDDMRVLRALVGFGVRRPMTVSAVLIGVPGEFADPARELAGRYGRGALLLALDVVARARETTADELDEILYERSGIHALLGPIRELAAHAVPQRLSRLSGDLNRLAAAGVARDELEMLLSGDLQSVVPG